MSDVAAPAPAPAPAPPLTASTPGISDSDLARLYRRADQLSAQIKNPRLPYEEADRLAWERSLLFGPSPKPRPRCQSDLDRNPTGEKMCECGDHVGAHARNPYGPCHMAGCPCLLFTPRRPGAGAPAAGDAAGAGAAAEPAPELRRHRNHARKAKPRAAPAIPRGRQAALR